MAKPVSRLYNTTIGTKYIFSVAVAIKHVEMAHKEVWGSRIPPHA